MITRPYRSRSCKFIVRKNSDIVVDLERSAGVRSRHQLFPRWLHAAKTVPPAEERRSGAGPMFTLHRRDVLKGVVTGALLLPAGRIRAQDRAAIEEGARQEGKLAIATSVTVPDFPKFLAAFTQKY